MKPATPRRGLLSHLPSVFACPSLGILMIGLLGQAFAEAPVTGVLTALPVPALAESDAVGVTDVPDSGSFPCQMADPGLVLRFRRCC